jgi:hypothetical protein
MAASVKTTAFWNIALCILVEVDQSFRRALCTSEKLIYFKTV